ncbi:MAG: hypothetical protein II457_02815, partial [Paludibacteraceae bacterium]|nr:hypothetical protein [Paludibacteraceae bacterium]
HYFRVCKCGHAPEPGLKAYSRFYQYAYVCIYRELKAEQQAAQEQKSSSLGAQNDNSASQTISNDLKQPQTTSNDISFSPIALNPSRHYTPAFRHRTANDSAHKWLRQYTIPSDA